MRLEKFKAYLMESVAFKLMPPLDQKVLMRILVQAAHRLGVKV